MSFNEVTCKDGNPHEFISDDGWRECYDSQSSRPAFRRTSICNRCLARLVENVSFPSRGHGKGCECPDGRFCKDKVGVTVIP